ncbi:hypothetical protein [Paenibacillus oleatilyticus]|uniref:hypothetical protein n=1 Tax=Paenibacillus oleatilyticus TaxID=2594886 RepID=UPI001C1FDFBD|nr:hypothetical protein [Paenibacillus oleatilyticus]MBU7317282.1 hypothetical protein [Paenibacillus oleatilyticus]
MEIKYYLAIAIILGICGLILWKSISKIKWETKLYRERNERLHEVNFKLRDEVNKGNRIIEKQKNQYQILKML